MVILLKALIIIIMGSLFKSFSAAKLKDLSSSVADDLTLGRSNSKLVLDPKL